MPTLVTHGLIHSMERKRCLTPDEHLLAMGFPVFEGLPNHPIPWQPVLEKLSCASKKRLAGNGMYLPLVGHCLLYLLGNIEKKTPPMPSLKRAFSSLSLKSEGSQIFLSPPSAAKKRRDD